jgi:hypothetical protein
MVRAASGGKLMGATVVSPPQPRVVAGAGGRRAVSKTDKVMWQTAEPLAR